MIFSVISVSLGILVKLFFNHRFRGWARILGFWIFLSVDSVLSVVDSVFKSGDEGCGSHEAKSFLGAPELLVGDWYGLMYY